MKFVLLYLAGLPGSTLLLAQTSPSSDPWIDSLLKSGPFGLVLVLIIMDKIGTHGERDRLRVEVRELRQEIRDTNQTNTKEIMPPLLEIARVLPRVVDALEKKGR